LAREKPQTIRIAAVTPNHYTATGQCYPKKVTFFFALRHATRPNLRVPAQ